MSEVSINLYASTLAVGYTIADGQITVTDPTGLPAGVAAYTVAMVNAAGNVILLFRVASRAGAVLTGAPETTDVNVPIATAVRGSILSAAAIAALTGGASLSSIYGDQPFTAPTTAMFATAAAGANATNVSFANDSAGAETGVLLKADSSANDTNLVLRAMAVPVAPWNIRFRFRPNSLLNSFPVGGFIFYDNVSGKSLVFGYNGRGNAFNVRACTFSALNVFDGTIDQEFGWAGIIGRAGLIDLYVQDDGANRILSIISDGVLANRRQFFTGVNNGYLTPTHIGMCVGPGHNTSPGTAQQAQIKAIDWTQS